MTITNLFPRPDRPTLGTFNAQLFSELAKMVSVRNICLVPEWRFWQWGVIRGWQSPDGHAPATRYEPALYLPFAGRSWAAESYVYSLRGRITEMHDANAVLAAWLYPDGVAAARLAREAGVPAWIIVQGSDTFHLATPRRKAAVLDCARHVTGFLCVCRLLADRLVQAGVPANKVWVIPNGVDTARFRSLSRIDCAARIASAVPGQPNVDGRKTVLFVGNLVPVKGPDVALDAFDELLRMGGRTFAELVVVGDGTMREGLETLARDKRLSNSVHFLGARQHDEIADWMNVADVLVLSSHSEGMPNVALEALACGLPVVATDVGACREMLGTEPCARLAASGDVRGLASAMKELLDGNSDRAGLAARHGCRTWADMAREIIEKITNGR